MKSKLGVGEKQSNLMQSTTEINFINLKLYTYSRSRTFQKKKKKKKKEENDGKKSVW